MGRLTEKEIKRIIQLTKKGLTLNKITRILGKKKTTVYYHFRKIKGKTFKPIILISKDKESIGEFIGLFAGDGSVYITNKYQYKTYLHFNVAEEVFVKDLIENVLVKLFGKSPMRFVYEHRLNLCYYSKNIHKLIEQYLIWDKNSRKTYSVRLKDKSYPKKFIIGFLRGSLDSDGHFSNKKISFASVSKELITNISEFLNELNIVHSIYLYKEKRKNRKNIYQIYVMRSEHKKFIKAINPRNKVKYKD